jgi:hypothetical protein
MTQHLVIGSHPVIAGSPADYAIRRRGATEKQFKKSTARQYGNAARPMPTVALHRNRGWFA